MKSQDCEGRENNRSHALSLSLWGTTTSCEERDFNGLRSVFNSRCSTSWVSIQRDKAGWVSVSDCQGPSEPSSGFLLFCSRSLGASWSSCISQRFRDRWVREYRWDESHPNWSCDRSRSLCERSWAEPHWALVLGQRLCQYMWMMLCVNKRSF